MRFLNTRTGRFEEKDPTKTVYAILSHTWDNIEQTHKDIQEIQGLRRCRRAEGPAEEKGESQKVVDSNVARGHGGLLRFP